VCEVGRVSSGGLRAPCGAPASPIVPVTWPHIVAAPTHVVDHSVSVDPHSVGSAGLDHISEFFSSAMSSIQLVAHGLVVEPPRVELAILGPLEAEDAFRRWEDFDSHPAHLANASAFSLNVSIRPPKHLYDGTLLPTLIGIGDVDRLSLPDKVEAFQGLLEDLPRVVCSVHHD